jgi:hypothetical protein
MNEFLRTEAMRFMSKFRGRDNAVRREELLFHLRLWEPNLDERGNRKIYTTLPICSCQDGLFIPKTSAEVKEFHDYILKGWGPVLAAKRMRIVLAYYPNLCPVNETQQDLGI